MKCNPMILKFLLAIFLAAMAATATTATMTDTPADDDPYRWLEDVDGADALGWVATQNSRTRKEIDAATGYAALYDRLLAIYNSNDRIPAINKIGAWYYNFWRDAEHERGIMRRTSLDEYRKSAPVWETMLDIDALAKAEGEIWVWKGWDCRYPNYRRCLVELSRGGGDASVTREFDLERRAFIAPESGGFYRPEAKGQLSWVDADTVHASTDFGRDALTESGYPRVVKIWKRGEPLEKAVTIFEGEQPDVASSATRWHVHVGDHVVMRDLITRHVTFFTNQTFLRRADGSLVQLDLPSDSTVSLWRDQALVSLRSEWKRGANANRSQDWPAGALLAIDFERFLRGERDFTMLFTPGPRKSIGGVTATLNTLLINELSDVQNRVFRMALYKGAWQRRAIDVPRSGTVSLAAVDADESDDYFVTLSSPLVPTTLALAPTGANQREALKALPAFFDALGAEVSQHEAASGDGTRIPYLQIAPRNFRADGSTPTILYGYGGFNTSMLPRGYSAVIGSAWLEQGGVFVVAGIRGGGEFGPAWHQAAIKEKKQKSYDDFIAVAVDLIRRKTTSAAHLGTMGGSNGGLLVGAVAMQRPELFKAVVSQVPLLDMRRYNKLLAGASWMGEYGNPDEPADWAFISKYSPYQNVAAGQRYPRMLFTTSTRDDRVHPGHARKMAAKMEAQGHDVLYFENTEGGHAGAANNTQQARMSAIEYTFMLNELRK